MRSDWKNDAVPSLSWKWLCKSMINGSSDCLCLGWVASSKLLFFQWIVISEKHGVQLVISLGTVRCWNTPESLLCISIFALSLWVVKWSWSFCNSEVPCWYCRGTGGVTSLYLYININTRSNAWLNSHSLTVLLWFCGTDWRQDLIATIVPWIMFFCCTGRGVRLEWKDVKPHHLKENWNGPLLGSLCRM